MSRWTMADIKAKGIHVDPSGKGKKIVSDKPKVRLATKTSEGKSFIEWALMAAKIEYKKEYRFSERRFRFDYFIPKFNTGIEYEGVMASQSRHTGVIGYTNDCVKYNLSQLAGIRVLRYTTINYKDVVEDLKKLSKLRVWVE